MTTVAEILRQGQQHYLQRFSLRHHAGCAAAHGGKSIGRCWCWKVARSRAS
jgi:hypothetical protein